MKHLLPLTRRAAIPESSGPSQTRTAAARVVTVGTVRSFPDLRLMTGVLPAIESVGAGASARIVNGSVVFEPRAPLVLERLARSIIFALSIPRNTTPRLRKAAQ